MNDNDKEIIQKIIGKIQQELNADNSYNSDKNLNFLEKMKKEGLVFYNGEWVKEIYAEQQEESNLRAIQKHSWLLWKVGDTTIIKISRNMFIAIVIAYLISYLN